MDESSARPFSDVRTSDVELDSPGLPESALPGLNLKSHASRLTESAIRAYHLSTIFNLADTLEEGDIPGADQGLTNNLRNLAQHDVGLFSNITQFIGEGATFSVRRTFFPDSRDVAFKTRVFDAGRDRERPFLKSLEAILLELRVLTHPPLRQHPNIIGLLLVGWQGDALNRDLKWPVLVVDYADRGTLVDFFENELAVDNNTKIAIISDIVAGLRALHDCLIVHGDLKLLNVLVFSKEGGGFTAKLSDFGGALLDTPDSFIEPTGTPPWTAPEYKTERPRQQLLLSDVYAVGLLFWRVVLDGSNPFTDSLFFEQSLEEEAALAMILKIKVKNKLLSIAKQSIRTHQPNFDLDLAGTFLSACLTTDPGKRSLSLVELALNQYVGGSKDSHICQFETSISSEENMAEKLDEPEEAELPELKLSLGGLSFENVTLALREPVLQAFEHTAKYDNDPERRKAAMSILSRMYLGSEDFGIEQNVDRGLQYLLNAAESGSREDAALVFRFHKAFGRDIPAVFTVNIPSWLREAAATGSMTAFEDLEQFGFIDKIEEARTLLKTRYCGYGEEIFEFEEELLTGLADPFGLNGIAYVKNQMELGVKNSQDLRGYLIRISSAYGCSGAVRYLVNELGADINDANAFGHRPLLFAARSGHAQALFTLLELGADPRLGDTGNDTPLHWLSAFEDNEVDAVAEELLRHEADLQCQASQFPPDGVLEYAETEYVAGTPLHRAVCRHSKAAVRNLLAAGADPNTPSQDDPDRTPTALAALLHYPDILQLCLDFGGGQGQHEGQNLVTPSGRSLLIMAMDGGSLYKMQLGRLIRHGDEWKARARETFSVLFKAGAGTHIGDLPGEPGCTAIFYAARRLPHILQYLVEQGAGVDLDKVSRRFSNDDEQDLDNELKRRPIFEAILFGKAQNALKLLELGANPCAGENDQMPLSAIYECASASLQDLILVEELCKRGVGVDDGPDGHETPFCCAVRGGNYILADYLRSKGANINALSSRGLLWSSHQPQTLLGLLARNNGPSSIAGLRFLLDSKTPQQVDLVIDPTLNQTVFHSIASLDGDSHDGFTASRALQLCEAYFNPDATALNIRTLPHDHDDSVESRGGNTALHLAVIHANFEVVVFLLERRASTSIRNNTNMTAIDLAALAFPSFESRFLRMPVPTSLERQLKTGRVRRDGIWQLLVEATPGGVNQDIIQNFTL